RVERSQFGRGRAVGYGYLAVGEPVQGGDHVGEHSDVEARVDLGGAGEQYVLAAGTWTRSGAVKKSRSSVGLAVRCCASSAAPPASRKPLLAGSAKNILATSSWKGGSPGWPSPAITPPPRRTARPAAPTRTGPLAAGLGRPTGRRAARRRRRRGCRKAFPPAGRPRTRGPGRPATA